MTNTKQKIAIVTGANSGLGYETSLGLAKAGYRVVMACRTEAKAAEAMKRLKQKVNGAKLDFITVDLVDRTSIRQFTDSFLERFERLDLLVNNAGVMGPPYTITQNNLELQFDANHIGHFYLTSRLMSKLDQPHETRVVNVSSLAIRLNDADINFDNLNFEGIYDEGKAKSLKGMGAYSQSKLANILFTMELKDRLAAANKNIKAVVAHPGMSNTALLRNLPVVVRFLMPILSKFMTISTAPEGAQSILHAALHHDVASGGFYGPTGKRERVGRPGLTELPAKAHDKELCAKLWAKSEQLLGMEFKI